MEILKNLWNLLISPRFQAFYWNTGCIAIIGFLNLLSENIVDIGLPVWAVGLIGLGLSQLTKAVSNYKNDKPMGFVYKQNIK